MVRGLTGSGGAVTQIPEPPITRFLFAGEVLVGLGLIVGCLTGIAAFFGGLMNVNYLFAGTVSSNPLLFVLATWLVLAWRIAGWYGLDRWVLPWLGTPWQPGTLIRPQSILLTVGRLTRPGARERFRWPCGGLARG